MLGRQRRRKHYQWFSLLFFRGTKKKNLIKFVNMNRFFPLVTTWVSMTADPMSGSSWSSNFLQYHLHLGANNNLNLHTLILSKNVCFKLQLCTRLHRVEFEIKSINQTLYFLKSVITLTQLSLFLCIHRGQQLNWTLSLYLSHINLSRSCAT